MVKRFSLRTYFDSMRLIVLALRDEIGRFYSNVRCEDLIFNDMSDNPMNPRKLYGSAIVDGGSGEFILEDGFVGYSPGRERIGYNPHDINDFFLRNSEKGTLIATIEPCGLINSPDYSLVVGLSELLDEEFEETVFENVKNEILPGRFHYYINDPRIKEACEKVAGEIDPSVQVLELFTSS